MADTNIQKLEFVDVNCSYGYEGGVDRRPFAAPKSFAMDRNSIWILKGDNGSGKTSFFKTLLGAVEIPMGRVRIHYDKPEFPEAELPVAHLRKSDLTISYLAQKVQSMFPDAMCVGTVIAMWARHAGLDAARRAAEIDALGLTGLVGHVANKHGNRLSGGEAQLIAMLLVVLRNPNLVLLDEPTAAISQKNRPQVLDMIQRMVSNSAEPRFVLVATHDPEVEKLSTNHVSFP